ncbi:MAG: DUF5702 domain-containing protein [Oscillospiraceae bacterium]|jgi:hypothetical protein|nr:DUF5702 domain-containing protein [Oscillospiraceae bacterium]
MRNFRQDNRGVVTVIVTLLLVPAILVSGTAVDLARAYTAKSLVQDGNQLAANSVLTQYNALLQDLYGLFGFLEAMDDPTLTELITDYVSTAVFGENWKDTELGSFQLFYGSNLETTFTKAEGKNLANKDVLRRQIEEYMKFRAPVVIAAGIIDLLKSFDKVAGDADAIKDKMEIDEDLEEINKYYKDIYEQIKKLEVYQSVENSSFSDLNHALDNINAQLRDLRDTRRAWENTSDDDADKKADLNTKYNGIITNIQNLTAGSGSVKTNWVNGSENSDGDWVPGRWRSSYNASPESLKNAIDNGKASLNAYKPELNELVRLCKRADDKKTEIMNKVAALRSKINSGSVSDDLKSGLGGELDKYEALLKYNIKAMADAMKRTDDIAIDNAVATLENAVYGLIDGNNNPLDPRISRSNLSSLSGNGNFAIDVSSYYSPGNNAALLGNLANLSAFQYYYSAPGDFRNFDHSDFNSTKNKEFYDELKKMFGNTDGHNENEKKNAENNITSVFDKAQELFNSVVPNPAGAKYYKVDEAAGGSGFGSGDDWGDKDKGKDATKDALGSDFLKNVGSLLGSAADKILLLTYDTEMFSSYATNKGAKHDEKSLAGIPYGTKVNYFYQSEQEFLFHGNEKSARTNITVVSGMLLLVRFVFNYIASFTVTSVVDTVNLIKATFSWAGPWAVVIGELARVGFALAESAIDVSRLHSGRRVALMKNNSTWKFSVDGLINSAIGALTTEDTDDPMPALYYTDYMRIFLLFVKGDDLAERTAKLIALNVTNYSENVNADEGTMSGKELFKMDKAITDFSLTTTVDLRMLFLSLPLAQRGQGNLNGTLLTLPIKATDYRGY